jgi:hypothetical protein
MVKNAIRTIYGPRPFQHSNEPKYEKIGCLEPRFSCRQRKSLKVKNIHRLKPVKDIKGLDYRKGPFPFHSLQCEKNIQAPDKRINLSLKPSFHLPHMEYKGSIGLLSRKMKKFFAHFHL